MTKAAKPGKSGGKRHLRPTGRFTVSIERGRVPEAEGMWAGAPEVRITAKPSKCFSGRDVGFDSAGCSVLGYSGERDTKKSREEMLRWARVTFIRSLAEKWGISIAIRRPK